jgi:hypothetical protein
VEPEDEIETAASGRRRREALATLGLGAAAAALAACGIGDGDDEAPAVDPRGEEAGPELRALFGLRELERRAERTYRAGAGFSGGRQAATLRRLADQARAHVAAYGALIAAVGGTLPEGEEPATTDFIRDPGTALGAAHRVGRRLIDAYLDAIPEMGTIDRRRELMTMLGNDAQHLVVLGGPDASAALPGGRDG